MEYPTPDQFIELLLSRPVREIAEGLVLQRDTPHVFLDHPQSTQTLFEHLSAQLRIEESNLTIVGSSKLGFALSPDNFPRRFSIESDIDVVVVERQLFDTVWKTLLEWNYPRRHRLPDKEWRWLRKRQNDLYWGWFRPDRIRFDGLSFPAILKPVRDISTTWFNAFKSLSLHSDFAAREVFGRLYRTWDHAMLYHMHGLRELIPIAKKMTAR